MISSVCWLNGFESAKISVRYIDGVMLYLRVAVELNDDGLIMAIKSAKVELFRRDMPPVEGVKSFLKSEQQAICRSLSESMTRMMENKLRTLNNKKSAAETES